MFSQVHKINKSYICFAVILISLLFSVAAHSRNVIVVMGASYDANDAFVDFIDLMADVKLPTSFYIYSHYCPVNN